MDEDNEFLPLDDTGGATQPPMEPAESEPAPVQDFPDTLPADAFAQAGPDFPDTLPADAFAQAGPDFPDMISPSDFDASPSTATPGGAFARGAVEGAAPSVAGMGAGVAAGAAIGSAFAPGVGTTIGAITGGLAAGLGAGVLVSKGQDWVLDALGLRDNDGMFSRAQRATDEAQHPYMHFAGEMAPALPFLRPGTNALTKVGALAERGVSGAIGGAATAGSELYQHGEIDPVKVAMGVGAGVALPSLNRLGEKFIPGRARPQAPGPEAGAEPGPTPGPEPQPRPGVGGGPRERPLDGEVLPPDVPALEYQNTGRWAKDIESAVTQRDGFDQTDPMWKFWDDYLRELQSRDDNKGWVDVDASLGPRSEEHPFTYRQSDAANDVTTVAAGVANENPPAPRVREAGNPIGAPMVAREGARPNDPARSYGKGAPERAGEVVTQPSTKVSQAPIHEDVAAALAGEQAPPTVAQQPAAPAPTAASQGSKFSNLSPKAQEIIARSRARETTQNWQNVPAQTEPVKTFRGVSGLNEVSRQKLRDHIVDTPARNERVAKIKEKFRDVEDVTAAVTPQEKRVLDAAVSALREANMTQVLAKLESLPPKQQAIAATKLLTALQSKSGEATAPGSAGEVRMPSKRPEIKSGVMARSKDDAARKQGVLDAYEKAAAEHGRGADNEPKGALLDRLAKMVKRADELSGGKTYHPNVKPPSWSLIQAARKTLAKPTPKNIEAYRQAEAMLQEQPSAKPTDLATEQKNLEAETTRIEAEITKKPHIVDAAAEALIERDRTGKTETPRSVHEKFENTAGEESAVYTRGHNQLTDWLNALDDDAYKLLKREHPDLDTDVKATQDPHELLQNLQDDLVDITVKERARQERRAAPVTKREQVTKASELPDTPKASKGRRIDPNSEEGRRIAAAYGGVAKKVDPEVAKKAYLSKHEDTLAAEQARLREGAEDRTVAGDEPSAIDHFWRMMTDESGSVPMDKFMQKALDWMKPVTGKLFSPKPADHIRQYADQLGYQFHRLVNRVTQYNGMLRANARTAPLLAPAENGRIYRAWERGEIRNLPGKLHEYYKNHIAPLERDYGRLYDEYKELAEKYKVPGWEEMPERKNNGNGFLSWVPKMRKGKQKWDHAEEADPYIGKGQTLSPWASTAQLREFFAIQNTAGERLVIIPGEGHFTIIRNGAPQKVKLNENSTFKPTEIGSTIKLKVKGKEDTWTLDHAGIDETKLAMGKNPNGTWRVEYHDNPLVTMTNAVYGLNAALERLKLFDEIVSSATFQSQIKTKLDPAEARKLHYAQTTLPQFAGKWMPEHWAWIMDDFAKSGFTFGDSATAAWKEKLDRASSTLTKGIVIWSPLVQAWNIADKWMIGRGSRWVTPKGWKSLVQDTPRAIKSVWTQDVLQQRMVEAGMNPMLLHTLTHDLMPQVAKAAGLDIARNPSRWDPLAKAFNITTPELGRKVYDMASAPIWWMSDVMATQRFLEELRHAKPKTDLWKKNEADLARIAKTIMDPVERMRDPAKIARLEKEAMAILEWQQNNPRQAGTTDRDAAKAVHDFVDGYMLGPTLFRSRVMKKVLSDPSVSMFGHYHYGLLHSWGKIFKNMLGPNSTKEERLMGAGQAVMAYMMLNVAYAALTAGYSWLTSNPHARVEPRGTSRVSDIATGVVTGKKPAQDFSRNVLFTPSVPFDSAWRLLNNQDWRGKPILDMQNMTEKPLKNISRATAQLMEFAAGQVAPPYKTISNAANQPGATPGSVAGKFVEDMIIGGLKTPSPAAVKREQQLSKIRAQAAKARERRPAGLIERGVNWLTGE